MMKNQKRKSDKERKYFIEYIKPNGDKGKTKIWKENPDGLINVWMRESKSDYTGTKVVLGYTKSIDGEIKSHTKTVNNSTRYARRIRLKTFIE